MQQQTDPVEFICVIGRELTDWSIHEGKQRSQDMLAGTNARVITYDELISNSQQAYRDFLDKEREAGRVYELVKSIEPEDAEELGQASNLQHIESQNSDD